MSCVENEEANLLQVCRLENTTYDNLGRVFESMVIRRCCMNGVEHSKGNSENLFPKLNIPASRFPT
jgi:hypothetical protein